MSVKIIPNSRLRFAKLYVAHGVEFWDALDLPTLREQEDDLDYQVRDTSIDRIDLLATRFYGDPALWWVIAAANGFEDVPTGLNEGDTIKIPSPRYVLQELLSSGS